MEKPIKISGNLLGFGRVQVSGNLVSSIDSLQVRPEEPLRECWFDYENQCWVRNGKYIGVGLGFQSGKIKIGQVPTADIIDKYKPANQGGPEKNR